MEPSNGPAMQPASCPRFDACNAPVCPLDAGWRSRTYLRGEAVCSLVLEAAKPDGAAVVREVLSDDDASAAVICAAHELPARDSYLRRRVERAARQRSRRSAFRPDPRSTRSPAANVA